MRTKSISQLGKQFTRLSDACVENYDDARYRIVFKAYNHTLRRICDYLCIPLQAKRTTNIPEGYFWCYDRDVFNARRNEPASKQGYMTVKMRPCTLEYFEKEGLL